MINALKAYRLTSPVENFYSNQIIFPAHKRSNQIYQVFFLDGCKPGAINACIQKRQLDG